MDVLANKTESSHIILHITPDVLKENSLSVSELFTLAGLYNVKFEEYVDQGTFENLESKGFLDIKRFQTKLSNQGLELIRRLTTLNGRFNTKRTNLVHMMEAPKESNVSDDFVRKYRSLFKGTKVGAMGGEKGVKHKLERFMEEYPKATEEIILEATRRYINNLNDYRYIQQADYFIYKRNNITHDETSNLSAYVDEVISNPGESEEDWTVNII